MATPETKTELLKSHLNELTKTHIELDGSGRDEYIYIASADAANGAACIVTRLSYNGLTSKIIFAKEYYSTWNSAWDVF